MNSSLTFPILSTRKPDPKSHRSTAYKDKVDWRYKQRRYKRIFEDKSFPYDDYEIRKFIIIVTGDINQPFF